MKKGLLILFSLFVMSGFVSAWSEYKVGDIKTYNEMQFYVIKASDSNTDSVIMLKAEPLTTEEINKYGGVGTDNNHVNRYTYSSIGEVTDSNGYGHMAYYSSDTCGYNNGVYIETGCTTDYNLSDAKYVVDAWSVDKFKKNDLIKDDNGYTARLITIEDLVGLGYKTHDEYIYDKTNDVPSWVYSFTNCYTMSQFRGLNSYIWKVANASQVGGTEVFGDYHSDGKYGMVRPVINIRKSALGDVNESEVADTETVISDNKKTVDENISKDNVKIPNTLKKISILLIVIGIIIISISICVLLMNKYIFKNGGIK